MKTLTTRFLNLFGIILLAAVMAFSFASCQNEPDPQDDSPEIPAALHNTEWVDRDGNRVIFGKTTVTVKTTSGAENNFTLKDSITVSDINRTTLFFGDSQTSNFIVYQSGTISSVSLGGVQITGTWEKAGQTSSEYWSITWNFNDGAQGTGAQHPAQIAKGAVLAKPSPDPTKADNVFGGWYADSGLTQAYNFGNTLTANLILYAKWEAAHIHQWGEWTATTIEGTEQRVCGTDQSHIEHRLTGTDRFSFKLGYTPDDEAVYFLSKGDVTTGAVYIPSYYRPNIDSDFLRVVDIAYFDNCIGLTSITIPEGITGIISGAFAGCSNLTSITVDVSNPFFTGEGGVLYAEEYTRLWAYPSASGAVTIPAGVLSIESDAFHSCTNLTSVTIPEGVTYIGNKAFYNCTSLTSVTIPASVTSYIDSDTFRNCTSLTSIMIDSNNSNYTSEGGALYNKEKTRLIAYPSASGAVTIPASVTSIGSYAFYGCTSLTSVTIPSGVTEIGMRAFFDCTRLTSITIPEGVTSIGSMAFAGCTSITSVTIPASVTAMGNYAFYNWTSSQTIYIEGHASYTAANTAWGGSTWRVDCEATIVYQGGN